MLLDPTTITKSQVMAGPARRVLNSDYIVLAKFVVPLAFTDVAVDIGEQFLNRSIAHSANVVDTLAAFGLAYVLIKFFVGVLEEVKQVGVVLVQDRPGFHKILACVVAMGLFVVVLAVVIAQTRLGVWLFEDLHGVSCSVGKLTHQALLYMSAYPLLHAISWLHGGVLLQYRHSALVGVASLSDIIAQIISVAILLWTPLICHAPIAVPILAAYCGVLTRCAITLSAFYYKIYPQLSRSSVQVVTVWKLVAFISPLMFVLGIQRSTRPTVNLLASHFSASQQDAAVTVAVLTATYPLGHIVYGWLNQVRPVSPAFQKKSLTVERRLISGRMIALFVVSMLGVSALLSFTLLWIPGVSVLILEHVIGIPHQLALLCVDPLRVFAFFCFTVAVRASLTGWLTLHRQTKFVTPSGFLRVVTVLATFFTLYKLGMSGALLAVLALFSGFFAEMITMSVVASIFACWRRYRSRRELRASPIAATEDTNSVELLPTSGGDMLKESLKEANSGHQVSPGRNLTDQGSVMVDTHSHEVDCSEL